VARPGLPRAYFEEIDRQLERLPDGLVGPPIEPVTLRMSRADRAQRRAARECYRTLTEIERVADERTWWIEVEPDVRLPGDLLGVPDLAGWRLADGVTIPDSGPVAIAPTFCCKVISTDTARNYRVARLPFYARAGVQWFWLIDPMTRTIEVLENAVDELVAVREAKAADEPLLPPFDRPIHLARWWLP
jgi:Uma2 family endonuclease